MVDTSAGTTAYTENAAPTPIDPAVTVTDPDWRARSPARRCRSRANFAGAQDVLALARRASAASRAIQVGDTLTLSGTASTAAYQAALRDVTYANSSDSPSTLLRTVTFTVTDDTALSGSDTKSLQVTAVDDNPVAVNDCDDGRRGLGRDAIFVLTNDTDVDGGPIAVSSVTQPANGTVVINGGDRRDLHAERELLQQPAGAPPPDTFTYTLTPGGSSATVSVTVTCVDDPPDGHDVRRRARPTPRTTVGVATTPIDGGLSVTVTTDAGAIVSPARTVATYRRTSPARRTCLALDTFTLHAQRRLGRTVSVTVTLTSRRPRSRRRPTEDRRCVDVHVNVTDPDGGPKSIAR